jgi:hypothetical protein
LKVLNFIYFFGFGLIFSSLPFCFCFSTILVLIFFVLEGTCFTVSSCAQVETGIHQCVFPKQCLGHAATQDSFLSPKGPQAMSMSECRGHGGG